MPGRKGNTEKQGDKRPRFEKVEKKLEQVRKTIRVRPKSVLTRVRKNIGAHAPEVPLGPLVLQGREHAGDRLREGEEAGSGVVQGVGHHQRPLLEAPPELAVVPRGHADPRHVAHHPSEGLDLEVVEIVLVAAVASQDEAPRRRMKN